MASRRDPPGAARTAVPARAHNDNRPRHIGSPEMIAAAGALALDRPANMTLRLDAARHLRLRLACAAGGQSAQAILIAALDAYLKTMPAIERLAAAAQADGGDAATFWGTDR